MGQKPKICVTDDEPALAEVLCEGLKAHDFDAFPAYSGADALAVCRKEQIEIILLDVDMPKMDGYTVCERIKADEELKNITVIFVTGKGEPEDHERGFNLGAVDYITKPFNLPMVMVRVEAALRMKHNVDPNPIDTEGLQDTYYTDYLTGLKNQRFLMDRLQEEMDKSQRYDFPVSCVIIDVDKVKAIDEETGPVSIDDLLSEAAMSIRSLTRSYDVLARYDGTLFVAVLPHAKPEDALEYGRKVMDDIEATTFSDPNFPSKATVCVSAVTIQKGDIKTADEMFGVAMKTLLDAKSQPQDSRIIGKDLRPQN